MYRHLEFLRLGAVCALYPLYDPLAGAYSRENWRDLQPRQCGRPAGGAIGGPPGGEVRSGADYRGRSGARWPRAHPRRLGDARHGVPVPGARGAADEFRQPGLQHQSGQPASGDHSVPFAGPHECHDAVSGVGHHAAGRSGRRYPRRGVGPATGDRGLGGRRPAGFSVGRALAGACTEGHPRPDRIAPTGRCARPLYLEWMFRPQTWGTNVTDQKELYWAWALTPLPPPGSPTEAAFVRMRLIAPAAALRRTVAEFAQLGGVVSTPAPAAPTLQDRLQVVLAGTAAQFERFMGEADPPVAAAGRPTLYATIASPPAVTMGRHQSP